MLVNVYFSGRSATGSPWTHPARADDPGMNRIAAAAVRSLSGGAPVFMATVEIPDNALTTPPVVEIGAADVARVEAA